MIPAERVLACLYSFAQSLQARHPRTAVPADIGVALEALLSRWRAAGRLTLEQSTDLTPDELWCLTEMLIQYVSFLSALPHLRFPSGFLADTSETALGAGIGAYIDEHRWPFPQQLPH